MTTEKIYGPWIEWHGGECPVPPYTAVHVKLREEDYRRHEGLARDYFWNHYNDRGDIVKYRTAIEQTDLEAAEKLLRDNGYIITPSIKRTITLVVNGREWVLPEPLKEAPLTPTHWEVNYGKAVECGWYGHSLNLDMLQRRLLYATEEDAQAWAEFDKWCRGGGDV